jgi:phosphatidate cytidylyltransferase
MFLTLGDAAEKRFVLLAGAWLVAFVNFWVPGIGFELLLTCFLGLFAYFLFTAPRHQGVEFQTHLRELVYSVFGYVYLVFVPLLLPSLRVGVSQGLHFVILFFLIVWAGDTGAYFAGRKFGKKKLFPVISPKKTQEGAAGGLLAGFGVTLVYKLTLLPSLHWTGVLIIPVAVGVTAIVGDLCESFIKRAFDKKDSGSLLPGHGGLLDRFDSVIFSLPVMVACSRIWG